MWPFSGRDKEKPKISIDPYLASCAILLANREAPYSVLHEKIKDLRDRGYQIGHRFAVIVEGHRSRELDSFLVSLLCTGYADHNTKNFSLNSKGVKLIEGKVLQAYEKDSSLVRRLAGDVGFDLERILQKDVMEHRELQERLMGERYLSQSS
jgi:hypothetical protein